MQIFSFPDEKYYSYITSQNKNMNGGKLVYLEMILSAELFMHSVRGGGRGQ